MDWIRALVKSSGAPRHAHHGRTRIEGALSGSARLATGNAYAITSLVSNNKSLGLIVHPTPAVIAKEFSASRRSLRLVGHLALPRPSCCPVERLTPGLCDTPLFLFDIFPALIRDLRCPPSLPGNHGSIALASSRCWLSPRLLVAFATPPPDNVISKGRPAVSLTFHTPSNALAARLETRHSNQAGRCHGRPHCVPNHPNSSFLRASAAK